MFAATYIRVSVEDKQLDSPQRQLETTRHVISSSKYVLSHSEESPYQDLDMKGWDENRPDLQRLIRDAKAGKFQVIVVDDWSRLTRMDMYDTIVHVVHPLREAGVMLHTAKDGLMEWDDVATQMRVFFNSYKNNEEVKDLSRRTLTGLIKLARTGNVLLGKTPYGLKSVREEEKDGAKGRRTHFVPADDITSETVKRIFSLCVHRNMGVLAIAQSLTADGVKTPRGFPQWSGYAVRTILMNRAYVGDYVFNRLSTGKFYRHSNGEARALRTDEKAAKGRKTKRRRNAPSDIIIVEDVHQPLIDRDLFLEAQERLRGRRRKQDYSPAKNCRPLAGLLVCASCGGLMYSWSNKTYRCGTSIYHGTCNSYTIREDKAITLVIEGLRSTLLHPDNLELIRKRAEQERGQQRDEGRLRALGKQVAALEEEIKNGYDLMLQPHIAKSQTAVTNLFARVQEKEVERDRLRKQIQIDELPDPVHTADEVIEQLQKIFWMAEEALRAANFSECNRCLRSIIGKVELRWESKEGKRRKSHRLVGGVMHLKTDNRYVKSVASSPSTYQLHIVAT